MPQINEVFVDFETDSLSMMPQAGKHSRITAASIELIADFFAWDTLYRKPLF